ncbi:uncharacterized protein LOC143022064 [Oratosquilla oratoria]|uniref:uncharacterized protein LOC143022064 n=1 Tax=Oratosquilla oratoria TaxID=337810 RepID=UPI003F77278E
MEARTLALVAAVLVTLSCAVSAFHPDRTIYKWSPLWLNSVPRGFQKRFRDVPIYKWSPQYFDRTGFYDSKRSEGMCGRENSICAYYKNSADLTVVPCCGHLQCRLVGNAYTCTDPEFLLDGIEGEYQ